MNENTTTCDCGTVVNLAADRRSPIKFNKKLNEYDLISNDGKIHHRMYFCFFCGGKLPASRRASLFAEPSEKEMKEITELMGTVHSIQQAKQILGEPDETVKAPKAPSRENGNAYSNHHRYLKRWKTLDLTLRERKDGSIESAFTGKYKGEAK